MQESIYNAGDEGSIPGSERSSGEGNGNSPTDREDWLATVHGVTRVRHSLETKPPPPPGDL